MLRLFTEALHECLPEKASLDYPFSPVSPLLLLQQASAHPGAFIAADAALPLERYFHRTSSCLIDWWCLRSQQQKWKAVHSCCGFVCLCTIFTLRFAISNFYTVDWIFA